MKTVLLFAAAFGLTAVGMTASRTSAAVIGATVADASSGDYTLTSVSVTRGGAGTFTYTPAQLTGVDLTDVDAFQTPLLVSRGASLPMAGTRAALIEDGRLDTGVINITTSNGTNGTGGTPNRSVRVTFATPIVNSVGEDILLFDVNGDDGIRFWVNEDPVNGRADLTASNFSGDLLTGMPFTQYAYNDAGDQDIGGSDGEDGLAELESSTGFATTGVDGSATINAIGLDLSLVGIPLNGTVSSIRFQTFANGNFRLDPVLIVGLPAVPEPGGLAVLGMGVVALLRRNRLKV